MNCVIAGHAGHEKFQFRTFSEKQVFAEEQHVTKLRRWRGVAGIFVERDRTNQTLKLDCHFGFVYIPLSSLVQTFETTCGELAP